MARTDPWSETFILSAYRKGDVDNIKNFCAILTTYDISGGEKDFSEINNGCGGTIKKFTPTTPYEITLEGYAQEVGSLDNDAAGTAEQAVGFFDLMHAKGGATTNTEQPITIDVDKTHPELILCIMHTDSTSQADAMAITISGDIAKRDTYKNAQMVSLNQSFTDAVLKFSIKIKCGAFDKDGNPNVRFESTDGTATMVLPAVAAYI